jgi:hypothetical protein
MEAGIHRGNLNTSQVGTSSGDATDRRGRTGRRVAMKVFWILTAIAGVATVVIVVARRVMHH